MLGAIDVFFLATQRRTTPFLQVRLIFFFPATQRRAASFFSSVTASQGGRVPCTRANGWDLVGITSTSSPVPSLTSTFSPLLQAANLPPLSKHVIIRRPASVTTARNIPTYQSLTFGIGAHPLPWVVIAGPTKTFMLLVIAIAKPTYISLT